LIRSLMLPRKKLRDCRMPINANNKTLVETLCITVFQNHDFSRLDEIMRDDYIHRGFVNNMHPIYEFNHNRELSKTS
jgi:hypothetical protein